MFHKLKFTAMTYIYILTISLLFLPGCSSENANTATSDKMKCEKIFKSMLKDPDSYQSITWEKEIINEYYFLYETNSGNIYYAFRPTPATDSILMSYRLINTYRAKNGFGGYNTGVAYFLVDSVGNVQYEKGN